MKGEAQMTKSDNCLGHC